MAEQIPDQLFHSPLHTRHVDSGAKLAAFGGWEMPLEYTGSVKEHHAVRTAAAVFDVSHLGKALVRGAGAAAYVDRCLTNDLGRIAPGQAQYTLCCNRDGGVVDDLLAYLRGDDEVFLVPNAANAEAVVRLLREAAPAGVDVVDQHHEFAVIAVQGQASDAVLAALRLPTGHQYMSFAEADHDGVPVVICRTGYTGERGYELIVPRDVAGSVWDRLLAGGAEHGVVPAGLGARDTLRTEMGYPLHGQDLTAEISPVQARLGWAVGWKKPAFWGREALVAQKEAGPNRLLRGLVANGRGIPRPRMSVASGDGVRLGEVTSGTFSPTRRLGVGLALLDASVRDGDEVHVDVRGRRESFTVTKPPFVTPGVRGG